MLPCCDVSLSLERFGFGCSEPERCSGYGSGVQLHKRDPKHSIVVAAATILDNYGIADLTMRRLARELDVTPAALYWHFASKQQLLGAVADQLLDPDCAAPGLAAGTDWRHRVTEVCTRLRDALLSHPDGAELVSAKSWIICSCTRGSSASRFSARSWKARLCMASPSRSAVASSSSTGQVG